MLGQDAIAEALAAQGVDTMFGVLGDGNLFIAEAMMRNHGLHYVSATHEANAVSMAEGWGRAAGRLGVATVTHGPGLTNTVTPLVEAVRNRTPLLLVAADTPVADRAHLQNLDQHAVVMATGAGFEPVRSVETIASDIAIAIRRAHAERRPIVLNVPLNLSWEEDVTLESLADLPSISVATEPDPEALDLAVGILATAARPIVLAGRGAVKAEAHDALVALADRLGAPLATTVLGSGYFRNDNGNLGIFGTLSNPVAAEAIASSDCVITFGAGLNNYTTDQGMLLKDKSVIQCDFDVAKIGSSVPIAAGIVGDARKVAQVIDRWLTEADHQPSSFRSADLQKQLDEHDPAATFDDLSTNDSVDPRTATLMLDKILPDDRTVVIDAGRFMIHALTLPVPEPLSLITSHGFGSIGLGMSNAIGAAVARTNRPTVLCVGDGGFMMGGLTESTPRSNTTSTSSSCSTTTAATAPNTSSCSARTWTPRHRYTTGPSSDLRSQPSELEPFGSSHWATSTKQQPPSTSAILGNQSVIELSLDPDVVSSIMH